MISVLKNIFHFIRRLVAKFWLMTIPAKHIAVGGSQGKTNTTTLIYEVLKRLYPEKGAVIKTDTNLDTIYNIPITALKAKKTTKYLVFEVGIDKPNEMEFHLQLVKPIVAVFTGLSAVHSDAEHLGSYENLVKEERKLTMSLDKNGYAVLNYDDIDVRRTAKLLKTKKIFFFGSNPRLCRVYFLKQPKVSINGTEGRFYFKYTKKNRQQIDFKTPLIGTHHIYNIMASFAVLMALSKLDKKVRIPKFYIDNFVKTLSEIKPLQGRMSIEKGPQDTLILNDALRANPKSAETGLQTFDAIDYDKGKKIVLMGEMGELEKPELEHKKVGRIASKLKTVDYFIGVGQLQKNVLTEIEKHNHQIKTFYADNPVSAGDLLKKIVKPNDFIYIKASLLRHIQRALLVLEGVNVGCKVVSCPFYHSCRSCKYLYKGYKD